MLNVNRASHDFASAGSVAPSIQDTVKKATDLIRRRLPVFMVIVPSIVVLAVLYLLSATPLYTATASMVIDTRHLQLSLQQQPQQAGADTIDPGTVLTQIELLKSQNVSLAVIKNRHLENDPEFVGNGSGLLGAVVGLVFGKSDDPSGTQLQRRALKVFEDRRDVARNGLSYVMDISFSSASREKSAEIANDLVEAYIVDQLDSKYQATKRASLWLQDRLRELRTQASLARKAVVDFKQAHNIMDTGGTERRLMSDQQLSEVQSQLILTQAATAEAKARYDRIKDIMKQEVPDASVTDALKSEVIIKLRQQYLDIAQREAIWAEKYGHNHLATVNLRNQMLELRKAISDEMNKIALSYGSEYEIAQAREKSLRSSLADAISTSQTSSQAQVQLGELESNADSYKGLYDNFLQRYMEAVQQESFPITEARLISAAVSPTSKSSPKGSLVLALSVFGGVALSFAVAMARELSDRVFRSSEQIEDELQVNCLALVPKIGAAAERLASSKALKQGSHVPDGTAPATSAKSTGKARDTQFYAHVLDAPFSQFAEALRTVKVAVDLRAMTRPCKVIGLTSSLPREGKSTFAANFGELIAHSGARVVIIDSDLRNPSLSRHFAPDALGLFDVLAGRAKTLDVLRIEERSGMRILPAGLNVRTPHTNELLASENMRAVVEELKKYFDYIIVDLPPLLPVVDARATTGFIDAYIFAVEWGRTKIDAAMHALSSAPELHENVLGVVLCKADTSVLRRYEQYRSGYYANKYYGVYGYSDVEKV